MAATNTPLIGLDLGGTKIAIAAFHAFGEIIYEDRVTTPKGDYAATLDVISRLVTDAEAIIKTPCTIGVGIPCSLSPQSNLVRNANSTWLNGKPLSKDLERLLGREIKLENDANCFALSEARDGAGVGARKVFGVIIGTGCGGGLVVDGRLVHGANAIAGEWGHNPLPWPDESEFPAPECWCGKHGCNELWLSGSGIERDHFDVTGEDLSSEEVHASALRGDQTCGATLTRHANRLARGLANIVNLVDPDVIVLGGGLSKMNHLYEDLPNLMATYVFSDVMVTAIAPPVHGDTSGVRGAAWLWHD